MSSGMFPVWVVCRIEDPRRQNRFLVTFVDQETADEWWRAISENADTAALVRRVTPRLYSYTIDDSIRYDHLYPSLLTSTGRFANVTQRFLGKFVIDSMVQQADGTWDRAGPQQVTDRVSGNWFCIRSMLAPHYYWYHDRTNNMICPSSSCRTRFQITIHNPGPNVPEKAVMIRSDDITIRISKDLYVGLNHNYRGVGTGDEEDKVKGPLVVTSSLVTAFKFSELAAGNFVSSAGSERLYQDTRGGEVGPSTVMFFIEDATSGEGEAWELVS
ncbi:hypothetical protein CC2G_012323 [Coprinopsis cinerea AmutBmut pab1-1]|nr:hypothetical protein CC2G_012323 [Coprinopsis cinerea AmutBmut pab1-1]